MVEHNFPIENPYVVAITPAEVTVVELDSLTMRFRVALNSDGNTWDTSRTSFTLVDSALNDLQEDTIVMQRFVNFRVTDTVESPQDYELTIPVVDRNDAGTYMARVAEMDCTYKNFNMYCE